MGHNPNPSDGGQTNRVRPTRVAGDTGKDIGELRNGTLEVRLSATQADIEAAQALRYRVFYDEMHAKPTPEMAAAGRDFDSFDAVADHLMVIDHALGDGPEAVVGTYRLIQREAANRHGGFYTADEYDIARIVAWPGPILELGRSCTDARYRNRPTMQLLWKGIAAYVFHHGIELMFGCASLPGNDVDVLAPALSYLHQNHLAPPELRPVALPDLYTDMNRLPADQYDAKRVLAGLPPLIKGYLRLGGYVGDGAVIDRQFNTTDVCVIVKTDQVTESYYQHYARSTRDAWGE
ncbi:MAG: GNAT family N-acetyltransferase [Alphaproteobacteria bacterium]|nr:GNAT family N-acetyltransferase [Alphaproteobacteria bacterium]MBU0796558.1 GNAT family N-acetyltransferase [Alphaproteobacteria bacterium]MBU0886373.1 GNAT family N-acetyltransferase [Alphaproteobacteria bacterium]MBU1813431.1 GNAT family N-acetyltransferase [Alphaproteobacteria bacterium]MBU2090139.1 GNAT family N-acetyltransferase [Alphaproteobacteria bacterium]